MVRFHVIVYAAALTIWAALSASIVPIHALARADWVDSFLLENNFTPLLFSQLARLSSVEVWFFLSLYLPRLLFLVFCLRLIAREGQKDRPLFRASWKFVVFLLGVIGTCKLLGYPPGLLAGFYLLSYCMGRLSEKAWKMALTLSVLAVILLATDLGRGQIISLLVTFFVGRGRLDFSNAVFLSLSLVVTVVLLSLAKFEGTDVSIGANLFDRISNFHQFKLYLWGVGTEFSAGRPVTADLVTSLPVIRSFFPQLDEAWLFSLLTGGSVGGLAVGPEIRALAYWVDSAWIYADLTIAFALLYSVIAFVVRRLAYGSEFLAIPFILLINFDSLNSAVTFLQLLVIFPILIALFQFLTWPRRPNWSAA